MNLLAWPCGSIISGHLFVTDMMMPFSIEKASAGRPSMFHCRTVTGSARIFERVQSGVKGRPLDFISPSHSPMMLLR